MSSPERDYREHIRKRIRAAYEFLRGRQRDYQLTFQRNDRSAMAVLTDLAQFCRANQSCFDPDPRKHAVAEGRREVWLRIANHLHLTLDDLYELQNGRMPKFTDDEETEE